MKAMCGALSACSAGLPAFRCIGPHMSMPSCLIWAFTFWTFYIKDLDFASLVTLDCKGLLTPEGSCS